MAGIGDYIHLSAKNYLLHGTTREGAYNGWASQKENIKKQTKLKNKSPLTLQEKNDLEQTISAMMNMNPGTAKLTSAQYGVENILNQSFGEKARQINWNTGGVDWSDGEKEKVVGRLHRTKNEEGQLELDLQDTLDKARKLKAIIEESLESSSVVSDKLKSDAKKIKELFYQAQRKMKKNTTKRGWYWKTPEMSDYQLMQNINTLIEEYAAYPAINAQRGLAFEAMIAMAPYVAQGMAYEEAAKQITGAVQEKVEINPKKFASFLKNEIGSNAFVTTSGSTASGKVDVVLSWHNKIAKISAKNVNLSSGHAWIHLLSGSSLLYLLQDVNSVFVNHFLNLVAEHPDSKEVNITDKKNKILKEIKLILFYKALTGSNYGRSSANTFVINDNSRKGGVRVFCMNDIIESVLKNENPTRNISVHSEEGEIGNLKLPNDFVLNDTSGAARISNLLIQAHQQKISVKFNASNVLGV